MQRQTIVGRSTAAAGGALLPCGLAARRQSQRLPCRPPRAEASTTTRTATPKPKPKAKQPAQQQPPQPADPLEKESPALKNVFLLLSAAGVYNVVSTIRGEKVRRSAPACVHADVAAPSLLLPACCRWEACRLLTCL